MSNKNTPETCLLETTPDADIGYRIEKNRCIEHYSGDADFAALSRAWTIKALEKKYMYAFSWLGRPVIQLPTDILAIQEILWSVKPDLVIETGIAHGGSLVLSASILELLGSGEVIGIDIDIRSHNRQAIERHPLARRIRLIEGSSIDSNVVDQVKKLALGKQKVVVFLDSLHTHDHVLAELNAYAGLVSAGSYCVVFDTFIEDMPHDFDWGNRPWRKGNNPKTAVHAWIKGHPEFMIDQSFENRLMTTSAPDGFLYRLPR